MTDQELKEFFITLVDDEELDDSSICILFNTAKNKLELEAKPRFLVAEDSSKTGTTGDNYLITKALPDDFRFVRKFYYGTTPLKPIPFEDKYSKRSAPNRYYIDHKNQLFAQTGNVSQPATYHLFYQIKTPNFDSSDFSSRTLTWPDDDFDALVAFEAASIYQSTIDADDLAFRISGAQEKQYRLLRESFMNYNSDLGVSDNDDTMGYADEEEPENIGSM